MKKFRILFIGAATLMVALVLNFRHALNDYGIKDNKVHVEVLANSSNSYSNGSSSGWIDYVFLEKIHADPVVEDAVVFGFVAALILYRIPADLGFNIEFGGKQTGYYTKNCVSAYAFCNQKDVGMYYVVASGN